VSIELQASDGRPKYWVETSTRLVRELSNEEQYEAYWMPERVEEDDEDEG
jgi:hypothetical protein